MPIPNDYTRTTLAAKLMDILEDTATVIGWTDITVPNGDYDGIIEAVESQLIVADVADATDKLLVELNAAVEVWRAVSAQEVTAYDIGGLKEIINRGQVFSHARAMFASAQEDLAKYLAGLIIEDLGVPAGIAYSTAIKAVAVWW
jgi:hypothetical protein